MEQTIGASEVRRQFGQVLRAVASRGDRYVVERHGEPVAVLVPLEVYEQWQRARDAFFDQMEAAAARSDLSADDAETLANEAVQEVRRRED